MEWSFSPLVAVAIFLAFMFFGYGFGLFEGRGQGYKKRKKEEQEEKPSRQEALPPASSPVQTPSLPSLLRLSQDDTQNLHLEMDDQPVDTSALTSDQRRRLIELLTVMRPWLEGKPASAPSAPPSPKSQSAAPPQSAPVSTAPVSKPVSQPAPAPVEDDEEPDPRGMVAQIDEILQHRISGTPLAEKGVRLQESLQGGVLVWVGLNKFEFIDDVPDEEIKTTIRAAIAEWEKKYTPGL